MDSGATLFASELRARGVTTVFTLCGDHTNPLLEALDDAGIRLIDTRDERGAAWMAAGWALGTAAPGVVVVSNTPALTNAMTALADANASGHPVLCISGGVASADRGVGHPGDTDQAAIAAPLVKHAARVERADDVPLAMLSAWSAVTGGVRNQRVGAPGVAVLDVPLDVQTQPARDPVIAMQTLQALAPDPGCIADARAMLGAAERPVIIAGSGCYWGGAGDDLRALVEGARIPVFTARAARGLISDDHELCFGFPNLMAEPAQLVFGEADLVLVVGTKLDITVAGGAFSPSCRVIRVDARAEAFDVGRAPDLRIRGDAGLVLAALAEGAEQRPTREWVARLRAAADARTAAIHARGSLTGPALHPGRLVAEIARALPPDAAVTVDAGELALWALEGIPARAPASFHASSFSPLGALGMGVPWAIGLKLAEPERPVLAVAGDGSFGFTALEVETAVRHGVPISVVVGNDGGWGIVRHLQQTLHGRGLASDLPRAPYEMLAAFAGAVGDRVETPDALQIALTNALASPTPSVINAIIDPDARHDALALIAAMFEAKHVH